MKFQRYAKLILACGMLQGVLSLPAQPAGSITLRCNDLRQTIDGFGVGEADWADDVFIFPNGSKCLMRFSRLTDYMPTSSGERFFLTMPPVSFKQTLPLLPTPVYTWLSTPKSRTE